MGMGGKGSSSSSGGTSGGSYATSSTQIPNAISNAEYTNVLARANQAANTPYTPYSGELVAPLNSTQNAAMDEVGSLQGAQLPYLSAAQGDISASTQPLYSTVGNYESPYTQQVLNTTMAAENNQDAQQQQQVTGNAISRGAWGGDRSGIAASALAGQQAIANNQTNAGIENTGYQNAMSADEAQSWLSSQAGFGESNLGNEALTTGLTGANALMSAGNTQQQQGQAVDSANYEQYLQGQAYPFQTTSWLSGIVNGTNLGGSTVNYQANPSAVSQYLGAASSAVGVLGQTGAFGNNGYLSNIFKRGGIVHDRPMRSTPTHGIAARHFDVGGSVGSGGIAAAMNGGNPMLGNQLSRYAQMSPEQLQELSVRFPPTSSQGQVIQAALRQKQMSGISAAPQQPQGYDDGGSVMDDDDDYSDGNGTGADVISAPTQATVLPSSSAGITAGTASPSVAPAASASALPSVASTINKPNPWEALTTAGLGIMAGRSKYAAENIGQGALEGERDWDSQKQQYAKNVDAATTLDLDQKRLQDAVANRQMTAAQAANKLVELAQYHNGKLAIEQDKADQGRYSLVGGTQNDADGNPVAGMYKINSKTGDTQFVPGSTISGGRGGTGGGNPSVFAQKQNAWLTAHPGDTDGALAYASGLRSMTSGDALKAGYAEASKEYQLLANDPGRDTTKPLPDMQSWTDQRAQTLALGFGPQPKKSTAPPAAAMIPPGTAAPIADPLATPRPAAGGAAPAASDNPNPAKPIAMPAIGAVMNGFKYLGGDPNKQQSWQPVQNVQ